MSVMESITTSFLFAKSGEETLKPEVLNPLMEILRKELKPEDFDETLREALRSKLSTD